MNRKSANFLRINSISELYKLMGMPRPQHPLIGLIKLEDVTPSVHEPVNFVLNFYMISLKKSVEWKLKYGQNYYDFDEGMLAFIEPGQVISTDADSSNKAQGWSLVFHPDFVRNYPLAKTINFSFR